jgi:hypothetical protein
LLRLQVSWVYYVVAVPGEAAAPHRRLGSLYPGDRLEAVSDGARKSPYKAGQQFRLGPWEREHASGGDGMELFVVVGSSHSHPLGARLSQTGSRLE